MASRPQHITDALFTAGLITLGRKPKSKTYAKLQTISQRRRARKVRKYGVSEKKREVEALNDLAASFMEG